MVTVVGWTVAKILNGTVMEAWRDGNETVMKWDQKRCGTEHFQEFFMKSFFVKISLLDLPLTDNHLNFLILAHIYKGCAF